ncbi:MAG TPA: hypothetical protein VJS92_13465, partial [Candidatus Polarisedimenticolaceae bacterium]|nr:hypothetical protein [Candidatus Polarisedimenticolaceae bacterium]
AALATVAAFTWLHLPPAGLGSAHALTVLAGVGAGGLLLAGLWERTAQAGLLVAVHLAYDLLAIGQGWLHVHGQTPAEWLLLAVWILAAAALPWALTPGTVFRTREGQEPIA